MSVSDTAVAVAAARPRGAPLVRGAVPADYPAIRHVIIAAYRQYADLIAPDIFSRYLAGLLDLDTHARHGHLIVVEADGRIRGFGAFYPDASVQGFGFRRVPEFDFDMAARYGGTGAAPITALAYLHQLAPTRATRA